MIPFNEYPRVPLYLCRCEYCGNTSKSILLARKEMHRPLGRREIVMGAIMLKIRRKKIPHGKTTCRTRLLRTRKGWEKRERRRATLTMINFTAKLNRIKQTS